MARIFIIGSGVVGTATGRGFVDAGHNVTFIDVLATRVEALCADGFDARSTINLAGEPPAFLFLTLPTPNVGHAYDMSAFEAGVRSVGEALRHGDPCHTVVVRSTVAPGTAQSLVRPLLEGASGLRVDHGFSLASNPEFLRAATARDDFRWPWMTVVASRNKRTVERLVHLLTPFGGELRSFDDYAVAEFIKCAHNIYNATKISFWNEMWLVAKQLGLNLDDIASTVARSAEGSTNPAYGIRGGAPYGGVCLPKDTQGFLGFAGSIGMRMQLLEAVVSVNDQLIERMQQELASVEAGDSTDRPIDSVPASREAADEVIVLPEPQTAPSTAP